MSCNQFTERILRKGSETFVDPLLGITATEIDKVVNILKKEQQAHAIEACDHTHMNRQQRRKLEREQIKKERSKR